MNKLLKGNKGFTLIELIIVIIILGVLAATATPRVFSWVRDSRVSAVKTDIATVEGIVRQLYMSDPNGFDADSMTISGTAYSRVNAVNLKLSPKSLTDLNLTMTYASPPTVRLAVGLGGAKLVASDFGSTGTSQGYTIDTTAGTVYYEFNVR